MDLRVDPDTPAIEADAAELEMALINLVANARDAMNHAGRLEVRARAARPGEGPERHRLGYAVVAVSDSGQGMSTETLERAFEPFFTTKPTGSGTGLGLSQVYGFCVQAGGEVAIDSKLRAGTTVSMFLPATAKPAAPAETPARPAPRLSARVLLVEDNRDLSATIASTLESCGCVVTPASSAYEAERLIDAPGRHFDVVLSDIVMPGARDGVTFAAHLRERRPELPVVLMTGYSREVGDAVAMGLDVLTKPCAADDIVAALSKAVRRAAGPMH
jgi:two-component system, NtrC family, sensor kinase